MMEKRGIEEKTYEVVIRVPGRKEEIIATSLSLKEANEIRIQTPNSFVRPEGSLLSD